MLIHMHEPQWSGVQRMTHFDHAEVVMCGHSCTGNELRSCSVISYTVMSAVIFVIIFLIKVS